MKRSPFLLLALLGAVSCAGPSVAPNLLAGPAGAAQSIRENFDPRSLNEDLLLIQPVFQRKHLNEPAVTPLNAATIAPISTPPLQPTGEPVLEADAPPENDIVADLPVVEYGPVDIFRLQLVTLSNEAVARKRQVELEQSLDTTIHLITRGEHFLLQAGQFETRKEAARLKTRVAALGPDYADAYVVSATIEAPLDPPAADITPAPLAIDAETSTEMVRTFGWRVLIDQFLSHDEADRLKRRAIKRLRRQDIDVTFKAPWYKVEVGHYRTDPEAQAAAEQIEAYYPNALKVRSQILVPREN